EPRRGRARGAHDAGHQPRPGARGRRAALDARGAGRMTVERYSMLIDGGWRDGSSGETIPSINPFTGQVWATAPLATDKDVDEAVSAARRAFDDGPWGRSTPVQRARLLRALAVLIEENAETLATIGVRENGKLIRE